MKQRMDRSRPGRRGGLQKLRLVASVACAFVVFWVGAGAQVPVPGQPPASETVITPMLAPTGAQTTNQDFKTGKTRLDRTSTSTGQVKGQAKSVGKVEPAKPVAPSSAVVSAAGILVDQVVGIVNGDLILESDVEEELRFEAFQPYRNNANSSRADIIKRLVDRQLILQQAKLNPDNSVTDAEAEAQLQILRKDIPLCSQYHCETEAGWNKFVGAQGFTQRELLDRWRQRMEILKFIEMRFRMGVQVTQAQIKTYYDKTLLPQFASKGTPAPKLASISERVQEILLQQQVSNLLGDWLKQLKAQGTVRMMHPDEVQP